MLDELDHMQVTFQLESPKALKNWHKRPNAPSFISLMANEARMRPDHWLGFMLCVYFTALTLLVGRHERHLT